MEKGQTLWQISRIYNVDLESIVDINHISASSHIENGQLIFIPSEEKPAPVKRYPSAETTFIWPIEGRVIATFGQNFRNMINKGINVRPINSMDVVASLSGRVAFCSENFGPFGKTIIIEHSNGFSTVYARNAQIMVKAGDSVQKGMVIAKAGSSGRDKDVYLHYEIRKGVIPQNPYYYLP
ncbi:MAG: LysM peptidoglycan-binding domain-containing M23 family metallopeptidase [Candidatus Omnitrophota bacterium]